MMSEDMMEFLDLKEYYKFLKMQINIEDLAYKLLDIFDKHDKRNPVERTDLLIFRGIEENKAYFSGEEYVCGLTDHYSFSFPESALFGEKELEDVLQERKRKFNDRLEKKVLMDEQVVKDKKENRRKKFEKLREEFDPL